MSKKNLNLEMCVSSYGLDKLFPKELLECAKIIILSKDDSIIHQERSLSAIYYLIEGRLQITHSVHDGRTVIFAIQNAPALIGELEFFQQVESNRTIASVEALTESTLLAFSTSSINKYGYNDPAFLRFICRSLSEKLLNCSLSNKTQLSTAEYKVKKYLLATYYKSGNDFYIDKREIVASLLGISVRHLNRVFNILIELGVIAVKNKHITIYKHEELI
ncbi:Crp/Fnr family transcriptional regulator [Serratia liquefaciens]|uniref:Crp/Fnr family transcriptional regulator n=1 Tax=Serratia liquefaciens TaxID=614 RepID=UPI0021795917|nr:Crp/Fnr family transcriptional regulator [Serratia liquefaciens]CAI1148950.1 Regulatory protein YeiL [Serratia liquefaciens]